MPGIESVDIKTLNRGSIEKATIKVKAYSREQFDIIDVLYLRLGYNVLLEWGNSVYRTNSGDYDTVKETLIEDPKRFFASKFAKGSEGSYNDILGPINFYRKKYDANYDGLFGKVSNFNWSFNADGSYDITITVVSLGDVIESLKANITPNINVSSFIEQTVRFNSSEDSDETSSNFLSTAPVKDEISSMLWLWKYVNKDNLTGQTTKGISITLGRVGDQKVNFIGRILSTGPQEVTGNVYNLYLVKFQNEEIVSDANQLLLL